MKKMALLMIVGIFGVLSGCATVPMASLNDDVTAKKFQVASGRSAIYLYRNEGFASAVRISVSIDDQMAGQTAPFTYFLWDVAPGHHIIKSHAEDVSSLDLVALPGKPHFIRQEIKTGMWAPRSILYEVNDSDGRTAINECKMAKSNVDHLDKTPDSKGDTVEVEKLRLQLEIEKTKLEQEKMKKQN